MGPGRTSARPATEPQPNGKLTQRQPQLQQLQLEPECLDPGDVPERPCAVPAETVWPSGLRRWLKAPVRKGVGSRTPQLSRLQSAPRRAEAEPASSFRCRGKADLGDWPDQQQTACANTCAATRQGCIGNWHVETAGPRNHTSAACGASSCLDLHRRNSTRVASHATHNAGTWCSGITSALHAEGPGFNPQCVHNCCTPGMCVCFSLRQPQARPAVRSIRLRPARARKASHCLNNAREDQIFPYSLQGLDPRPMAHKTIALTTELREHASALATRHR